MNNLLYALARLAQLQGETTDRVALNEAVEAAERSGQDPLKQLKIISQHLQIKPANWLKGPDAAAVPALIHDKNRGWALLRGQNSQGHWISEWIDSDSLKWIEEVLTDFSAYQIVRIRLTKPYQTGNSPVYRLIKDELFAHKKLLFDAGLGGLVIGLVALATSLYSMQVYDRVVPTGATQTLLVLTLGVVLATIFELVVKHVRANIYSRLIDQVDQRLSRAIFMRFLSIRLDQLPASVGGVAAQLRGYESIRSFLVALTSQLMVDTPFALLFLALIGIIAGPLALIPAGFFIISILFGLYYRAQLDALARKATTASNLKTGLLVEAIEGAETIKSGQGGWRMLSRWMKTTDDARDNELQMSNIQEHSQHITATFQQLSYVLLIATGSLLISTGQLTMGQLIACSILSGRVLTPAGMIPGQLMKWALAKAALQNLDRFWTLQDDHHGCEQPLLPTAIHGSYRFEDVVSGYGSNKGVEIKNLLIRPGEKVGIIGPIGGGKTTLLRLLSGMYKPQHGRILLDDMELSHISKPVLAEHIGYLQQDGRLFAGTLRENLILGMLDPGDDRLFEVARLTGLMQAVITSHPKGIHQEIFEGGSGLSGGQRQLVNLTRVFLRRPSVWLLDEPTASIDRMLELQVIDALKKSLRPKDTLFLVTHKTEMLEVVDRLIVVVNHQILMDGPKMQVLSRLQAPPPERADNEHRLMANI